MKKPTLTIELDPKTDKAKILFNGIIIIEDLVFNDVIYLANCLIGDARKIKVKANELFPD